jgi:hypothetical protein
MPRACLGCLSVTKAWGRAVVRSRARHPRGSARARPGCGKWSGPSWQAGSSRSARPRMTLRKRVQKCRCAPPRPVRQGLRTLRLRNGSTRCRRQGRHRQGRRRVRLPQAFPMRLHLHRPSALRRWRPAHCPAARSQAVAPGHGSHCRRVPAGARPREIPPLPWQPMLLPVRMRRRSGTAVHRPWAKPWPQRRCSKPQRPRRW